MPLAIRRTATSRKHRQFANDTDEKGNWFRSRDRPQKCPCLAPTDAMKLAVPAKGVDNHPVRPLYSGNNRVANGCDREEYAL